VSKLTADLVELSDTADQLPNRSHFGATQEAVRRAHSWYSQPIGTTGDDQ
jgi:hypothetical protein